MSQIDKAKRFCKIAHGEQIRKYTGKPYWTHPFAVAEIVKSVTDNDDAIVAAILHDTVEDTQATILDIEFFFGNTVAELVAEVTDISTLTDGNRKIRKDTDREHLKKASYLGKTIKLADLIHNTGSIVECDKNFAKVYMREKQRLLEILLDGNKILLEKANNLVKDYYLGRK